MVGRLPREPVGGPLPAGEESSLALSLRDLLRDHRPVSDPYARSPSPQGLLRGMWRWRVVILIAVVVVFVYTVAGDWRPSVPDAPAPSQAPGAVLGGHPPAADVRLGATTVDAQGYAHTSIVITNHSSKSSNYLIALTMRSSTGAALHETNVKSTTPVPSGASANKVADWPGQVDGVPSGATVVVTSVDRWAHV